MVAADTGLRIRAMLPLGTRDWQPYVDVPQYDPDGLKNLALPVIAQLKKSYGGMVYVVLTTRDINSADRNLRFVFAQHYPAEKMTVLSAARMLIGERGTRPALISSRASAKDAAPHDRHSILRAGAGARIVARSFILPSWVWMTSMRWGLR